MLRKEGMEILRSCIAVFMLIGPAVCSASAQQMRDTFVQTPSMSTHMVAFVVSGFDRTASDGGVVHAYSRDPDRMKYVSGEAPRLLKAMEDYTELQYQLPKLDLFAVPDFKTDAMGNWGLTTYR